MRFVAAGLVVALLVGVVASFVWGAELGAWFPPAATHAAHEVDALFTAIEWIVAVALVATLSALAWSILRGTRARDGRSAFVDGNTRLEIAWTIVPAIVLIVLSFVQLNLWHAIRTEGASVTTPLAEVWAQQFGWRFRYPGPDGRFGTDDDFERPYELVVPANEPVLVNLRSRDVIHSFFVPDFRLKQDVVPGRTIALRFDVLEPGEHELVCAQLCGSGHYKMAGRVRALARADYDAWLIKESRAHWTNGAEDKP